MKKYWNTIQKYVPLIGFAAVVILFSILTKGKILAPKNLKIIAEQSILQVVGAIGVVFVMSMGGVDFSQGSIVGMACIVGIYLSYISIPLGILGALAVGAVMGFLNGFIIAKGKMQSFVVTICMMYAFRGLTAFLTRTKAMQVPVRMYSIDNLTVKLIVVAALVIIGYFIYEFTPFGRKVRAVGAGEIGAKYSGIDVVKIKISAFTVAGLMGGAAAFLNILRVGTASSNTGNLFETNLMIALVLGGMPITGGAKSRYIAVVIGGVLLAFLANGLTMIGISLTAQQFVRGAIFLGMVLITADHNSVTAIK